MPHRHSASLVEALVHAHKTCTSIEVEPELIPASLEAAMAVQAQTVAALGEKIGGWKVGITGDGVSMAAPMFADAIVASGHSWPLTAAGPILAEVEIAVRLRQDLPPRRGKPYVREEIVAAISHVLPGIELIQSRLSTGMASPFPLWLADRLGNAGYVCGKQRADFAALDLGALRCQLSVDGRNVHDKAGGHPQNDPLTPILVWANAQNDSTGGLRAGQIITTGSLIVPLRCTRSVHLVAEIEGLGRVEVQIEG